MEKRKIILECPNYEVSDLGKVFNIKTGKEIKTTLVRRTGYYNLTLCNSGNKKRFSIHRLVLSTFIENVDNKPQVNHKNGDKSDNRLCNLEWNTRSENQKHSIEYGLRSAAGEKNSQVKINEKIALEIFKSNDTYKSMSERYNISIGVIYQIKNGKLWTHVTGFRHPDLKLSTDNKKYIDIT